MSSEIIVQTTESGIMSYSIEPESVIVSLVERPFSKSNPIIAGSSESALTEGEMKKKGARSTIIIIIDFFFMLLWQYLPVMKPMHR